MTDFNSLMGLTASLQVDLLGGVKATYQNATDSIQNITVIIDRDVEVLAENGMTTDKKNIATLKKSEVGAVSAGDRIITGTESFTVANIVSDDGFIVEVYVRG